MRLTELQQHKRHCITCNKVTDQVKLDAHDYYCLSCGTVGEPPLPDTNETLKAMIELISDEQKTQKRIENLSCRP